MNEEKEIFTVESFNEYKFKEKGSEFIGQVFHVECEEEADEILKSVKKKYYDARHHCYAFQLFDGSFRYSDDGEPNGTAGIRIHNAIKHFNLSNVLIISIRYFGGVKLGVGPLGKAYYNSAFFAVKNADIIKKEEFYKIKILYDYNHTRHIHHFLETYKAKITGDSFAGKPVIECLIRPKFIEKLSDDFSAASNNQIKLEVDETIILL
ncbi:MAG: YigZ family protein [Melioribacteraceae bacterium]|nr:YigZ family protein [Melioribacteraceae bacterium]